MINPQSSARCPFLPAGDAAADYTLVPFPAALRELGRSRLLRYVRIRGVPGAVLAGELDLRPAPVRPEQTEH